MDKERLLRYIQEGFIYRKGVLFRSLENYSCAILTDANFIEHKLKPEIIEYFKEIHIQEIEFNDYFDFSQKQIDFLKELPFIQGISDLTLKGVESEYLKLLPGLKNYYNTSSEKPIDFAFFKYLEIVNTIWTKKRAGILDCENLVDLILNKFKGKDLQAFSKLQKLKKLEFVTTTLESFKGIGALQNLERLEITYNKNLKDLSFLDECKSIRMLDITNCSNLVSLKGLDKLPNLSILSITNCKRIEDPEDLLKLERLKVFSFSGSGNLKSLSGIEKMQGLEAFLMYNSYITDGNILPLLKLKNLKRCGFSNKKNYNLKQVEVKNYFNIK